MRRLCYAHDEDDTVVYRDGKTYCRGCIRERWSAKKALRNADRALAELRGWMQSDEAKRILGRAA